MNIDDFLAVLIFALLPFAWVSTAVLIWAARKPPRIGALSERAAIAFVIALFLTAVALIVYNTETGFLLFASDVARIVFRLCLAGLGFVPVTWTLLWWSGRLGDGK